MSGRQAFAYWFVCGTFLLLGMCIGCTSEEREGHRVEFMVARADMDAASSSSAFRADGPGPMESSAQASSSSGGDGWIYGLGYSLPVGDGENAGQMRLMNAHLAGLRAEVAHLTETIEANLTDQGPPVEAQEPQQPEPAAQDAIGISAAPEPVQDDTQTKKALTGAAAVAVVGLASFLAKKYLLARFMGGS